MVEAFSPSFQNLPSLCQQICPICTEQGEKPDACGSTDSLQNIMEALFVMTVCVAMDFIHFRFALISFSVPGILQSRSFYCTLRLAPAKVSFFMGDVGIFYECQRFFFFFVFFFMQRCLCLIVIFIKLGVIIFRLMA